MTNVNYSTWMSEFKENALCLLSIPGSHDAGMYEIGWSTNIGGMASSDNAQTQSLTIGEQLNAGIRYFDIRPGWFIDPDGNKTYYTGHFGHSSIFQTVGCLGGSLDAILSEVLSFASQSHSEVIILKFSHYFQVTQKDLSWTDWIPVDNTILDDDDHVGYFDDFKKSLLIYVQDKLEKYLYKNEKGSKNFFNNTLKELTTNYDANGKPTNTNGTKIIAVFDKIPSSIAMPIGTYTYGDMVADSQNKPDEVLTGNDIPTSDLVVYDCYSNTGDLDIMTSDSDDKGQIKKYKQINYHDGDLYLLSWTLTLQSYHHLTNSIKNLADQAFAVLESNIDTLISENKVYITFETNKEDPTKKHLVRPYMIPNIIYIDYCDTSVTDVCIKVNRYLHS